MIEQGIQAPAALRVAAAAPVTRPLSSAPRSTFAAGFGRHPGPPRAKPRFSALPSLVNIRRGSGKGVRRKRKAPGSVDLATHEDHEREIALQHGHDGQGSAQQAPQHELPAPQAEREAGLFSWFDRLLGAQRRRGGGPGATDAQPSGAPRLGQQARPSASAPGGIPMAWESGVYHALLKAGLVPRGAHARASLFGHVPRSHLGVQAPASLLRRRHDEDAAASPVGSRLRGLLGGIGQWKAGLRGLLRGVASLLNGARAVLGYWFDAGHFRAAGLRMGASAGVRGWVFP